MYINSLRGDKLLKIKVYWQLRNSGIFIKCSSIIVYDNSVTNLFNYQGVGMNRKKSGREGQGIGNKIKQTSRIC